MTNEKTLNKIRALLAKTIENGCTEAEAGEKASFGRPVEQGGMLRIEQK